MAAKAKAKKTKRPVAARARAPKSRPGAAVTGLDATDSAPAVAGTSPAAANTAPPDRTLVTLALLALAALFLLTAGVAPLAANAFHSLGALADRRLEVGAVGLLILLAVLVTGGAGG